MSPLNVLVVGASIAGPSTAYWLARAGANITIIERFPSFRKGGQRVDIRTTGVQIMRKIPGMEETVRKALAPLAGFSFEHENGRPFAKMVPTGDPQAQGMVSEYEIFRDDLSKILYDITSSHERIKYVFDEQVASISQNMEGESGGKVKVEFQNGKLPTTEYDLVVACDGATSRTRAMGLGGGVRDHTASCNVWVSYYTIKKDLIGGSKYGHAHSTLGGRFLSIGPDHHPDLNRIGLMSIQPRSKEGAMADFRAAQKQGIDQLKQLVAKTFGGVGWKSDQMLEGMWTSEDFYCSEMIRVQLPGIVKGRFALVGDAGYAPGPTGCGTTLAMTGAYVLAGEIARQKGDLSAGLKGYEERMKPIVTDMQTIPPLVPTVMAPQTAWGIWFRNLVLSFGSKLIAAVGPYWSSSMASSDKYGLPDYQWDE